ncbi:hypothetical protein Tco_1390579 [Tanacetum coccineum]
METKDTLSSCSDLDEQEIQQLQKQAKILKKNSLNKLNALKTTTQHLSSSNSSMYYKFREAFHRLFNADVRTFKDVLSQNMQNLERQLNKETLHEKDSNSGLTRHEQEIHNRLKRLNERKLQIQECIVQKVKASDASSGEKDCSRIVSDNGNDQVEKVDSNVIPDSPNMCDNEIQNAVECDDERVVLANLIANLKLDIDENKKIQKQLRNAKTSLAQELKELSLRSTRLSQEALAQKEHDIKEGLKLKAYEISVVKEKHDELVKHSLLTKSHYEGLVKEKTKVITDLKLKEEKDIDKMISMEMQLKFLNEIVYKRNQSIQTIHMLAPKGPTFNGRPTFANLMYLKKAQSEKPCLYEIPHDQSDPANRLVPDREETLTLERESRSKLNKDLVRLVFKL